MHILLHFRHCPQTELYKEVAVSLEVELFLVSENAKFERRLIAFAQSSSSMTNRLKK